MTLQEKLDAKYYDKGDVVLKSREEIKKEVEDALFSEGITVKSIKDLESFKDKIEIESKKRGAENRKEYNVSCSKRHAEFQEDLEEAFGFQKHPKKDVLFRLAYEEGHSNGYYEVYLAYETLSELLS